MAGNGLFVRAKRREFSVCLSLCRKIVKGLPEVESRIVWHKPRISSSIWQEILADACFRNDFTDFKEDVFVVVWHEEIGEWHWKRISRERQRASTIADDTLEEYTNACIELHTHPEGAIHFSRADNNDEKGKFRIFGILTDIHSNLPKIRFRCGVYDHFIEIPTDFVSEMPPEFVDLNKIEQTIRKVLP
ncbi:MAG: hypothetical protein KDB79_12500 [Acidobacteria bacterium]|nr:hypothetical protein [Acidobacteriota bacterium]